MPIEPWTDDSANIQNLHGLLNVKGHFCWQLEGCLTNLALALGEDPGCVEAPRLTYLLRKLLDRDDGLEDLARPPCECVCVHWDF